MGSHSDLTAVTDLRIASSHRHLGEYEFAEKALNLEHFSPQYKIRALHEIALNRLLRGSAEESYEASKTATDVCESLRDADYELFAPSYGLQGLALLLLGKFSSAEELLQISARWSEEPTSQITSLVNLGYLSQAQSVSMIPFLPTFPTKESIGNSRENLLKSTFVHEAIDYWQEGIDLALKSTTSSATQSNATAAAAAAAAMCGPTNQFSPAGPGMETISVTPSGSPSSSSSNPSPPPENGISFEKKLEEDVDFAIAYANALCNIAEGSLALAESNRAADCLSSALNALQSHQSLDSKASPTLARSLMLMGCIHFNAAEGVTAEGLFRNSLDRLSSCPFAIHDIRHRYETARVLRAYGSLLTKWDKRERTGEEYLTKSDQILSQLPTFSNKIQLSQMAHLPTA